MKAKLNPSVPAVVEVLTPEVPATITLTLTIEEATWLRDIHNFTDNVHCFRAHIEPLAALCDQKGSPCAGLYNHLDTALETS